MNFDKLLDIVKDNAPAILVAGAVTGVITTGVLAAKAGFKAGTKIQAEEEKRYQDPAAEPMTTEEKVKLVWPDFVPAAATGALTITAVLVANKVHSDRAAAMASAYAIAEKGLKNYRDKVVEMLGEEKDTEIDDEVAKDKIKKADYTNVIITPSRNSIFVDAHSGRSFWSDMETIRSAVNDVNEQLNGYDYATLSDYYDILGIPRTQESDNIGWNVDTKLTIRFVPEFAPDGKTAVLAVVFNTTPFRDYHVTR